MKKHGIGKGLMTVWRATNPDAGDLPINFGVDGQEVPLLSVNNRSRKTVNRNVSYLNPQYMHTLSSSYTIYE